MADTHHIHRSVVLPLKTLDALGLAIAIFCRGKITLADDMLTSVDGYLVECVARHAKLAAFMAEHRAVRT